MTTQPATTADEPSNPDPRLPTGRTLTLADLDAILAAGYELDIDPTDG